MLLVSLEGFVFLRSWRGVTSLQDGHEALLEQLKGRRYFQHRYLRQKKKPRQKCEGQGCSLAAVTGPGGLETAQRVLEVL